MQRPRAVLKGSTRTRPPRAKRPVLCGNFILPIDAYGAQSDQRMLCIHTAKNSTADWWIPPVGPG